MVAIQVRLCDPFKTRDEQLVQASIAAEREAQQELDERRERELNPPMEDTEIEFVDLDVALDAGLPLGEGDECTFK